ncbi:hypothetical protein LWC34_50755 [Kibdelosporangium philippinense]|uniref:DUF6879 domain-containing protein n=1 Tax=Kibdelosporangium philippinense TaxID=211113 RepID=A0ABS8ZTJ1_9PSEU|nr:DUF6879 family protein [Kibdelosporangium philippinense]MCE7011033.1 hypothetical protein [Kibdelosporangium philippinense]
MPKHDVRTSILRKITVTSVIGGITFPLTNFLFDSMTAQLIGAVSVGAVTLVVQFLVDFERRLGSVEDSQNEQTADIRRALDEGFAKVSAATMLSAQLEAAGLRTQALQRLVSQAATMDPVSTPLQRGFIDTEIERVTYVLHAFGEQEATYNGEDREWLLGLTRNVTKSIDAISTSTADAGGTEFENGFWGSNLGQHYLAAQRDAVCRQVQIRRIFVVRGEESLHDDGRLSVCRTQASLGIDVRVLDITTMPSSRTSDSILHDFILFDDELSYDVITGEGAGPVILYTRLVLRDEEIKKRRDRFRNFWEWATPLSVVDGQLDGHALRRLR